MVWMFFLVFFPALLEELFKSIKSFKLQIGRSLVAVAAMYLWFYSISNIPLAEATAINFTAPIFGAICAIIFLGEKIFPFLTKTKFEVPVSKILSFATKAISNLVVSTLLNFANIFFFQFSWTYTFYGIKFFTPKISIVINKIINFHFG